MCTKVTPDNLDLLHKAGVLPDSCAYLGGTEPIPAKLVPFNLADAALQKRHLETRNLCLKMLSEDK